MHGLPGSSGVPVAAHRPLERPMSHVVEILLIGSDDTGQTV